MYNKTKGFALFYAVVIVGVISIVTFSVSKITLSEVQLSILGKRSQQAFFAADTGLECALYLDTKKALFIPQDILDEIDYDILDSECAGNSVARTRVEIEGEEVFTFYIDNLENNTCAKVTVTKKEVLSSKIRTTIESKGRDRCDGGRQVERTISTEY